MLVSSRSLMDSVHGLPELDTLALATAYERRALAACPQHLPLALRVLHRLDPARWALEWHLPWWLGAELQLDTTLSRELVLSNILGLASIRLRDDLLDGDVDSGDALAVPQLSAALYEAAIDVYRSLFPPSSELWVELAMRMAEWRAAVADNAAPPRADADPDAIARHLARRGAPLKVSAFAVCLLAGWTDVYPTLARGLDHALAAMVLYDHLCDWQDDLAAGRWNAFALEKNRAEVLAAMMATDAIGTYVVRIHVEFDMAQKIVADLGLRGLATQLAATAAKVDQHAMQLQAHYRMVNERAVALMFGRDRVKTARTSIVARLATG